jgi:hypothetical protein
MVQLGELMMILDYRFRPSPGAPYLRERVTA